MTLRLDSLESDQSSAKWFLGGASWDGKARAVVKKDEDDEPEGFPGPWAKADVLGMVIAAELPEAVLGVLRDRPDAIMTLRIPGLIGVGVYIDRNTTSRVQGVLVMGMLRASNKSGSRYTHTLTAVPGGVRWLKDWEDKGTSA